MQDLYNFIIAQNLYNVVIGVFVVVWGIPYGIPNYVMRLRALFSKRKVEQHTIGQFVDTLWLVATLWILLVIFK